MTPYEIMLSESQERMLLVADKGREDEVFRVFRKWGLDAVEIGVVNGRRQAARDGITARVVAEIPNRELADEAPLYNRPSSTAAAKCRPLHGPAVRQQAICCGRPETSPGIRRHLLQTLDLGAVRLPGAHQYHRRAGVGRGHRAHQGDRHLGRDVARWQRPLLLSRRAKVRSWPSRNAAAISRRWAREPVAATNCLNFGNPERPEIMAQLVEAIEGMAEACRFFETPITGGNVSLYNETLGEGIYPTPVIGIVGIVQTAPPIAIQFKNEGRNVMLLGGYGTCDDEQFGGTQYAKEVVKCVWGVPPTLDMEYEQRVQTAIRELVRGRSVESAHDLSDGGLAVALAECCFGAKGIGVEARMSSPLSTSCCCSTKVRRA